MDNFLSVTNDDLNLLHPEEAVKFFEQLLWAEATSIGIGKNLVNVPQSITTPDGGIDAVVSVDSNVGEGIIKSGLNCYQIKTGKFSPIKNAGIDKILFKSGYNEHKNGCARFRH